MTEWWEWALAYGAVSVIVAFLVAAFIRAGKGPRS